MSSGQMDPGHFILCLAAALKSPDIVGQLKQITQPNHDEFTDLISAELYRQLQPYKEELRSKDQDIKMLKKTIAEQNDKLDQLESMGGAIALECQVFLIYLHSHQSWSASPARRYCGITPSRQDSRRKTMSGSCEIRHRQYQRASLSCQKISKPNVRKMNPWKIFI